MRGNTVRDNILYGSAQFGHLIVSTGKVYGENAIDGNYIDQPKRLKELDGEIFRPPAPEAVGPPGAVTGATPCHPPLAAG